MTGRNLATTRGDSGAVCALWLLPILQHLLHTAASWDSLPALDGKLFMLSALPSVNNVQCHVVKLIDMLHSAAVPYPMLLSML